MTIIDNEDKRLFANKYNTGSTRIQNWNYSTPGYYFITICTYNRNNFFGKIINQKMELSTVGSITSDCLVKIPLHNPNVLIDTWVIMPNHIHFLLNVIRLVSNSVETCDRASLPRTYKNHFYHRLARRSTQTIPNVINQFKSSVKRLSNKQHLYFSWQIRYYEEIINTSNRLQLIRTYIQNNPINWQKDKLYI